MTISLAVDNGPTEAAWQAMAAKPDKYLPLIERVVGMHLMRATEDMIWDPELIAAIPDLSSLSDDEMTFVRSGANAILYQYDVSAAVQIMAQDWLRDGAPE